MEFTVILTPEHGAYNVTVPALPGCFTWGADREEALANAREAIALYLEQLSAEERPVPSDSETHRVAVQALVKVADAPERREHPEHRSAHVWLRFGGAG